MTIAAIADYRAPGGRFAKGCSGNPAGRPKGARNKTTLLAEALLDENAETLMRRSIDRAMTGDGAALRFLLGRILPPARADETIALDLAPGEENDLERIFSVTMRAIADGEIAPRDGLMVARIAATWARLREARARAARRAGIAASASRPVSALYSARAAGQGGGTRRTPDSSRESSYPNLPPRAGEGGPAPVSDLYSARAASPSPACGGGQGGGTRRTAGAGRESPHPDLPPRAGEGEMAPVSRLYFSPSAFAARPVSDLYSSTALARLAGVESGRGVPI